MRKKPVAGEKKSLASCRNSLFSSSRHLPSRPKAQLATLFKVNRLQMSLASVFSVQFWINVAKFLLFSTRYGYNHFIWNFLVVLKW